MKQYDVCNCDEALHLKCLLADLADLAWNGLQAFYPGDEYVEELRQQIETALERKV
jgi:hypothetical protein